MSWMSLFANLTFQQKNGGKSGWRELERATERERERERERKGFGMNVVKKSRVIYCFEGFESKVVFCRRWNPLGFPDSRSL